MERIILRQALAMESIGSGSAPLSLWDGVDFLSLGFRFSCRFCIPFLVECVSLMSWILAPNAEKGRKKARDENLHFSTVYICNKLTSSGCCRICGNPTESFLRTLSKYCRISNRTTGSTSFFCKEKIIQFFFIPTKTCDNLLTLQSLNQQPLKKSWAVEHNICSIIPHCTLTTTVQDPNNTPLILQLLPNHFPTKQKKKK